MGTKLQGIQRCTDTLGDVSSFRKCQPNSAVALVQSQCCQGKDSPGAAQENSASPCHASLGASLPLSILSQEAQKKGSPVSNSMVFLGSDHESQQSAPQKPLVSPDHGRNGDRFPCAMLRGSQQEAVTGCCCIQTQLLTQHPPRLGSFAHIAHYFPTNIPKTAR